MGLKKYSEYITENKNMKSSTKDEETPKVQEPKVKEPKMENITKKEQKKETEKEVVVSESIVFNGKVVSFNGPVKPSSTITLLEKKNISKDKLHYIISEQEDSIVILKYNIETDLKLNKFLESFIKYHKDNLNIFENITLEGTESYSIIKNIDNKQLLINNLIKLLK